MRRRKNPNELMEVSSFRLPGDVKAFIRGKANAAERSMSFIVIDYFRRWMEWENTESKQPKVKPK